MKKPLKYCVNGDGRPVQSPSWVLCKECLTGLDDSFKRLAEALKVHPRAKEAEKTK